MNNWKKLALVIAAVSSITANAKMERDPRRGSPAEYDPGPAKNSKWVELFGSAPNYRELSRRLLGKEKFRWNMGPMWYRGRLEANKVKVFVVGQEGAQDENISNRSFTGGTGVKMQGFLNTMGINQSYVFMNTFVYTIFEQRDTEDKRYMWLEQNPASPIVDYRHRLFNNVAATNPDSLSLIVGVGGGARNSVVTWITSHGGTCKQMGSDLDCNTGALEKKFGLKNKLFVVSVPHPGAAAKGGNVIPGFTSALKRIAANMQKNPNWLPADAGAPARSATLATMNKPVYGYADAPVPHRDFAFGTNWRMGAEGTASNRMGQDAIQVFSAEGVYNDKTVKESKPADVMAGLTKGPNGTTIPGAGPSDMPYEPPRFYASNVAHAQAYDPGPCGAGYSTCEISTLLQSWPNFAKTAVKPTGDWSFGTGASYRGRLDDAKILILADQTSHDDLFAARALTGEAGQRLQTWLNVTGAGTSYAILRTLPVDTLGMNQADVESLATSAEVSAVRNKIIAWVLAKNKTKVLVAMGPVAQKIAAGFDTARRGITKIDLSLDRSAAHVTAWEKASSEAATAIGGRKTAQYNGTPSPIARLDLPAHSRWWMGTSGDRAVRGSKPGKDGDYYTVYAPSWSVQLKPKALTANEDAALKSAPAK